jgi:glycosyltransferase involved in cell wall biosynthesis
MTEHELGEIRKEGALRVAVVAAESGASGGAERFYSALTDALAGIGHQVELIALPAPEPNFEAICANYKQFSELDLSGFDVVISTKAPTYAVCHPNHVVYLVHTIRAFDDMFESLFTPIDRAMAERRSELHQMDFKALCGVRKIFSIGHEVTDRLYKWRGLGSEVLHPPLAASGFRDDGIGDYFFMPGRLHPWKRVALAIEAVKASKKPMKLLISGTGEEEKTLRKLAAGDSRIQFLGHIDDNELVSLYAGALAIPFVSVREDYGYVTLEAFASGKPVLTCSDSGEPTRFVLPGETGLVCEPSSEAVREGLEWLFDHREEAAVMGQAGREIVDGMSWQAVATRLVEAAVDSAESRQSEASPRRVATLDMQPIDPPVGGGRLRLLGLYHDLGKDFRCHYVGTFDWPGEAFRDHWLSDTLREISVPLSDEHHGAAASLALRCGGKTVIDLAFSQQGHLSQDYIRRVRQEIREADVVVFSHPWVFPLVADALQPHQVVVYDSQNVEGFLRAQLLDESNPAEAEVLRQAVTDEYDVGVRADLVLACSHSDLARFNRIYEFDPGKMRVMPNGVMAFSMVPPTNRDREAIRKKLALPVDAFVAVFIGSPYGPNLEAAEFIATRLARALPDVTFVIAGGVSEAVSARQKNLVCTGRLDEADKLNWLRASNIAVNPMFSGSGTNIKMFDFMALGLPTVVTDIGARGIEEGASACFVRVGNNKEAFVEAIKNLRDNKAVRKEFGASARACVEASYSWERISRHLGDVFRNRAHWGGQAAPRFSVIVPSYRRHGKLTELMQALSSQIERDFEVIIVDQSDERWPDEHRPFGIPSTYIHTDVKGAVGARNTGAAIANGKVLAFTDDDCLPQPDWLLSAREYFENDAVVGVEGMVASDHFGDPEWRPVTNVGFEGLGFMTANMMVRCSAFQLLGGFDLAFDKPHFREDTEFGWRLQAFGVVPYGENVVVFHPAQPRSEERESVAARAEFFRKDALLYKKHPEKYRELFLYERHFEKYPGFAENLEAGFVSLGLEMPNWMRKELP